VYRLFIDEVGHDNLATADDPNERYLFLMGVCMDFDYALGEFADGLDELKLATFGTKTVVLHRREIIHKRPFPFTALADPAVRCQFDAASLELFRTSKYTALGVLIDKREHLARYEKWHFHPYHYCLTAMLERYVLWLESMSFHATGDVMCEWRGKQPNRKLEDAYTRLYKFGTLGGIPDAPLSCRLLQSNLAIYFEAVWIGKSRGPQ
jgi:hypothetical protein